MPFQPVPNAALVVVEGEVDGQQTQTTFGAGLVSPAAVTQAALQTLVDAIHARWVDFYLPQIPAAWTLMKVSGRVLDVEDGVLAEWSDPESIAGELAGAILPNNVSLALAFLTGLGGRTNRGRNYWPIFLESEVVTSLVDVTKAAVIKGIYDAMIGPNAIATGWVWSVISRKQYTPGGPGRAVPIVATKYNNLVVDSQRRRLPGRGR